MPTREELQHRRPDVPRSAIPQRAPGIQNSPYEHASAQGMADLLQKHPMFAYSGQIGQGALHHAGRPFRAAAEHPTKFRDRKYGGQSYLPPGTRPDAMPWLDSPNMQQDRQFLNRNWPSIVPPSMTPDVPDTGAIGSATTQAPGAGASGDIIGYFNDQPITRSQEQALSARLNTMPAEAVGSASPAMQNQLHQMRMAAIKRGEHVPGISEERDLQHERRRLQRIAETPERISKLRRQGALDQLARLDERIYGAPDREQDSSFRGRDLDIREQEAQARDRYYQGQLDIRAQRLDIDRVAAMKTLNDLRTKGVPETLLDMLVNDPDFLQKINEAPEEMKGALLQQFQQRYQQDILRQELAGMPEDQQRRMMEELNLTFADGGQVPGAMELGMDTGAQMPSTMPQAPTMPGQQQLHAQYMQYANGAQQMGVPPVSFDAFMQMLQRPPSQPSAVMGFAEGGQVPGAMEDVSGRMVYDPDPYAETDSIPAMIDGQIPAALDSGEFVIPKDVVNFYGTQKMQQLIEKARKAMNPESTDAATQQSALGFA